MDKRKEKWSELAMSMGKRGGRKGRHAVTGILPSAQL